MVSFARLGRPKFLLGGLLGGALGTAIACFQRGAIDWPAYALAQAAITSFHMMTHYANDYFDRDADALAVRTPFSGGSGVLVDGALAPRVALTAAVAAAALGIVATLALERVQPLAAFVAALIGVLAWSYSAPPLRLHSRALGECDTALVVALLVPWCAFSAQRGTLTALAIAAALPGGAAMFAMMLAVEYPDVEADGAAGKRNIVVRLGRAAAVNAVSAALVAAGAGVLLAIIAGAPLTLLPLAAVGLPAGVGLERALRRKAWERTGGNAEIAGRGVAFFFIVSLTSALAYVTALP
jgi:1,4-dihydroxy-2-naphthoate polyprenyltransferase